jgi:hypothetical protein
MLAVKITLFVATPAFSFCLQTYTLLGYLWS